MMRRSTTWRMVVAVPTACLIFEAEEGTDEDDSD